MNNFIKIGCTFLGIIIFIVAIIDQIDGIGRFAMILFGTIFSLIGSILSFSKNDNKNKNKKQK